MTLGFYENFPLNIHRVDKFISTLSNKQLQQKLIRVLRDVNGREYSFEEVAYPTVPEGRVIFEFGLAESGDFNYIDEEEVKKTLSVLIEGTSAFDGFFLLNTILQEKWRKTNRR